MNNNINVGDVLRVTESNKNGKPISFDEFGKVVLFKNNITTGFVKVSTVTEKEKYYLVTGKNIYGYDFYEEFITEDSDESIKTCDCKEFEQVLINNGYKIGYKLPFSYENTLENCVKNELQIFAYNVLTGVTIVADTWDNMNKFNSIKVTIPNVSVFNYPSRCHLSGSVDYVTLNLCNTNRGLRDINWFINDQKGNSWGENMSIFLWNYTDKSSEGKFDIWDNTIDRILLAPKEVELFMGNCKRMKPIFQKRNSK